MSDRKHRRPVTPARVDAAGQVRSLVHAVVAADADDATFARVAALAAEAHALLAATPHLPRPVFDPTHIGRMREDADLNGIDAMADRAVAGPANPTSVDIRTVFVDDGVEAEVTFGPAFEGAPGRTHGGIVAAVFDDLLGAAMARTRAIGFTGRLTVHYRAPVPIETAVRFRLATGLREGRKLHVHGDARLDDRVLATADALMILVDADHFRTHARELLERGAGGD
ncbi:MAG: PaaI family thioesterase [Actinomycetota bacterium]